MPGDAETTAANLRAMSSLWRFGIASEFVLLICAVPLLMILVLLLKPVNRPLVLLAALFNLVAIGVEAVVTLRLVEALFPLGTEEYLRAFSGDQLQALTAIALRAHTYGFGASLIFFGCFCVTIGVVIFQSGCMPRAVGVLMQIAGAGYLINNFALMLYPPATGILFPATAIPAFIGEMSLCLWLLFRGVDPQKWKARVGGRGPGAGEA